MLCLNQLIPTAIKQLNEDVFYQELLQHGQQPLLRSKLLLVGPGRAGKTSLLRRLTRQAFIEGQASTSGIDVDVHLWQQSSGSGEQMEAGSEFTNAAVRAAVAKLTEQTEREAAQESEEKEKVGGELPKKDGWFARKKREFFERQRAKQAEFQKAEERKNAKEAVMKTDYLAPLFGASSVQSELQASTSF